MAAVEMDLYDLPGSPPCRAVKMTAHLTGVKLNLHFVDLFKGKHLEPEYRKLNPFHKVPTINDHGFVLSESNAIMRYIVSKYAPGSDLYPQDVQKRALIDQWMSIASSTLFTSAINIMIPQIFKGEEASEELLAKGRDGLEALNSALASKTYLVGGNLTLADIAVVAALSEFKMAGVDMSSYPNVLQYVSGIRTKLSPAYAEINDKAETDLIRYVKEVKAKKGKS